MFSHKSAEKNDNEVRNSPENLSSISKQDTLVNQSQTGKIGSKVIPVNPIPGSITDEIIEPNHNSSNSIDNLNNNVANS